MRIRDLAEQWGEPFVNNCEARFPSKPGLIFHHQRGIVLKVIDERTGAIGGIDALARLINPAAASIEARIPRQPHSSMRGIEAHG